MAQLHAAIGKLKVSDDKLKASDNKLKDLDSTFHAFRAEAKQSVEDMIAEVHDREKEMARRFDAWTADGSRHTPQHTPVFGSTEQAFSDARADAEEAKDILLTAIQDL